MSPRGTPSTCAKTVQTLLKSCGRIHDPDDLVPARRPGNQLDLAPRDTERVGERLKRRGGGLAVNRALLCRHHQYTFRSAYARIRRVTAATLVRLAPGLTRNWQLSEVMCDVHTDFAHVVIGRTEQGVALFSDGERQSTEFSQLLYHEALLVPALLLAPRVSRVLVIGSGEGVVSQLAVAAGATHVDHIDIDREAVRLCAEHLPYGYTVDELLRAESGLGPVAMHYGDGWDFVARCSAPYDIVVVDLPDERTAPAQHNRLYDADFLARCRKIGRVVIGQAGCPFAKVMPLRDNSVSMRMGGS